MEPEIRIQGTEVGERSGICMFIYTFSLYRNERAAPKVCTSILKHVKIHQVLDLKIWPILILQYQISRETFKYLGSLLTNQNYIQEEIKCRLKAGN